MGGGLFVAVDGDDRLLHVNKVALSLVALSLLNVQVDRAGMAGDFIYNHIRQSDLTKCIADTREQGQVIEREWSLGSGVKERIIRALSSPGPVGLGSASVVVVLNDIAVQRQREQERDDFMSNISHELKTPLAALIGIVETMIDDPEMPTSIRTGFLERADGQLHRASNLVNDILRLARWEGGVPLNRIEGDLCQAIREALRNVAELAHQRGIAIEPTIPARFPFHFDHAAMVQLVENLLANAVRHSPEASHVRLGLDLEQTNSVLLWVEDEGTGVIPGDEERIFERFYRGDPSRNRDKGGSGIGLSIVAAVAMAHGGDASVTRARSGGARFEVRFDPDQV